MVEKDNKEIKTGKEEIVDTLKKENIPSEKIKVENKKLENPKVVKEVAVANLISASISTKHSVAICRMIRRKSIERALEMLELVLLKKLAVPMIGDEIPHRRRSLIPHTSGGGGRFPMNASKEFIGLVKQLKANCEINGIDNPVITIAMSNLASRPFKREGKRAKRTHVHLEARNRTKFLANKK